MDINIENLKVTYTVLKKIMEQKHLTKDTSFVRVSSYIAHEICDIITNPMFESLNKVTVEKD